MHEKVIRKKYIFKGHAVNFRCDTVKLINGKHATREFMDHPGAVGILPVIGDRVVLIKQYRYPVDEITYEIPAGKLGKRESIFSCLKRELAEEAGLKAQKIKKLVSFWPTCAFSDEVIHLYVAENLKPCNATPDYDEFLERVEIPLKKTLKWIENGKIKDSKTIIALSLYMSKKIGKYSC